MRLFLLSLTFALAAIEAAGAVETVTLQRFDANYNGYVCSADLIGSAGSNLSLRLSEYQEGWSIAFYIGGNPDVFLPLYGGGESVDQARFDKKLAKIQIGYDFYFTSRRQLVYAPKKSDLDTNTVAMMTIDAPSPVIDAVQSMAEGGMKFGDLGNFRDAAAATADFRNCALDALGVAD